MFAEAPEGLKHVAVRIMGIASAGVWQKEDRHASDSSLGKAEAKRSCAPFLSWKDLFENRDT